MAPVVTQPAIHKILTEIMQAVIAEETDEPGWE
jgi:hypothetical protein